MPRNQHPKAMAKDSSTCCRQDYCYAVEHLNSLYSGVVAVVWAKLDNVVAPARSHALLAHIFSKGTAFLTCMLTAEHLVSRLVAEDDPWADRIEFLMEVMVSTYERRRFQTEVINELPLYPTEAILWDENQVPDVHYTGQLSLLQPSCQDLCSCRQRQQ